MATDQNRASTPAAGPDGEHVPPEKSSYARLARRISAITTNCLLTAMVLIAGLGFGRQVLKWWGDGTAETARPSPTVEALAGLADPSRPHVLQFGDYPWSLRRQSISGDQQAAAVALRADCRRAVQQARLPEDRPERAEREFLKRLAAREPVQQESGTWRLYELNDAFPMVVGTRQPVAGGDSATEETLAAGDHRVVAWGLAIPSEPGEWTLCTFQPEPASGGQTLGLPDVPIPPDCARTLSFRVVGGGAMVAFEGPQHPHDWIRFYDRWFATHNWKAAAEGWRRSGSSWHARFASTERASAGSVDVHFGAGGRGRATGLIVMSPFSSGQGN